MLPRVFVNIVAWNSMAFLPDLLASLEKQTWTDFRVLVIDNGSNDGACAFLQKEYPGVSVLRNVRNLGFSPAHNQGIRYALERWSGEDLNNKFILVTNPDVILEPDFMHKLMETAQTQQDGSFCGKLLRAQLSGLDDREMREVHKTDVIDSTGLRAHRSRRFTDRGAGEQDAGQYDANQDIFGCSGALALYRASALQDVRIGDEILDHDFFAYKEDVDLAWRLRARGWAARYVPQARAYHYRSMKGKERAGWFEAIRNRRAKSRLRSRYSTRNHWNMLMKNDRFTDVLLHTPWIIPVEVARFLYVLVFETRNLRAFFEALVRLPLMRRKRAHIFAQAKGHPSLRRWFV